MFGRKKPIEAVEETTTEQTPPSESRPRASLVAKKIQGGLVKGIKSSFPKGIRNPDSMIRNKHLYSGRMPNSSKLFGVPKDAATMKSSKRIRLF